MAKKMMPVVAVLVGLVCGGCAIIPTLMMGTLGVALVGGVIESVQGLLQVLFGVTTFF